MPEIKQLKKNQSKSVNLIRYIEGFFIGIFLTISSLIFSSLLPWWVWPPPLMLIIFLIVIICFFYFKQKYLAYGLATFPIIFLIVFFNQSPFVGW